MSWTSESAVSVNRGYGTSDYNTDGYYFIGEEWQAVSGDSETWAEVTANSTGWSEVSPA